MFCKLNRSQGKQLLASFLAFFLVSCPGPKLFKAHKPLTQPEAGAVNLSVTMVAPWNDYASLLQPNFVLTENEALTKVIPKTTLLEERLLDALSMKAKFAGPQKSTTTTENITTGAGASTSSSETVKTLKPGELPSNAAIPDSPNQSASQMKGLPEKDKSIAAEPMLEYAAAAALFQEVRLLNHYVEDVALKYNYQPYVVRIQLAVLPFARNQPYDVYTTFTFFPFYADENGEGYKDEKAFVVPLLVTDNLEGTLKSRSTDTIRQLALALSFLIEGVKGELGLSKMREDLRNVMGTDLNSLMTVSRVTDSAIEVRLGAARQPTAGYAMIPRTHHITLLLMVPRTFVEDNQVDPHVKVVAKTIMRDIEDGKPLISRPRDADEIEMREILKTYYADWEPTDEEIGTLFSYVFRNDYPAFRKLVKSKTKKSQTLTRELWLQFIVNATRSQFSAAIFDLPRLVKMSWPKNPQAVLLLDDGITNLTGQLLGGAGLIPNHINARLDLKLSSGQILPIMATAVSTDNDRRDLTLIFPSLKAWKVTDSELREGLLEGSTIEIFYTADEYWNQPIDLQQQVYETIFYRLQDAQKH